MALGGGIIRGKGVGVPPLFRWNVRTLEIDKMKEAYEAQVEDLHLDRQ